jgi:hypothetical protein
MMVPSGDARPAPLHLDALAAAPPGPHDAIPHRLEEQQDASQHSLISVFGGIGAATVAGSGQTGTVLGKLEGRIA